MKINIQSVMNIINFLLLVLLIVTFVTPNIVLSEEPNTRYFSDISTDDWYYEATRTLSELGAFSGYNDGSFKPHRKMTRAEFMKVAIIARLSFQIKNKSPSLSSREITDQLVSEILNTINSQKSESEVFNDVPKNHWSFPYITYLNVLNIVSGYKDKKIGINNSITRAEALKIILKLLKIDEEKILNTSSPYKDVSKDDWYQPYILTAKYMRRVNGYSDGSFRPNNNITRAEGAQMLYQFSKLQGEGFEIIHDNVKIDFSPLQTDQIIPGITVEFLSVDSEIHNDDVIKTDSSMNTDNTSNYTIITDKKDLGETWYYITHKSPAQWIQFSLNISTNKMVFLGYQTENFPQGIFAGQNNSGLKINDSLIIYSDTFREKPTNNFKKYWGERIINPANNIVRYYKKNSEPESIHKLSFFAHPNIVFQPSNLWMDITKLTHSGENTFQLLFDEEETTGIVIIVKN